eukprot:351491-Chlamydomonas_euryale.AAC.39
MPTHKARSVARADVDVASSVCRSCFVAFSLPFWQQLRPPERICVIQICILRQQHPCAMAMDAENGCHLSYDRLQKAAADQQQRHRRPRGHC